MSGLYINSNVASLVAQNSLNRNVKSLENILTRLSTGLRINSGKDDPSGLIASEMLKSDITATAQAIKNTERANSMIAIADSALGQISVLLNDVRGLVNEAANEGAISDDQIAANQLQIDASLDSIDRIARTTTYMGKKLLDGSLDFNTANVNTNQITDLTITSANFGTQSSIPISIQVQKAAETAKLIFAQNGVSDDVILEVTGNIGSYTFDFQAGASIVDIAERINAVSDATGVRARIGNDATHGQLVATSAGANNDILFTAKEAGAAAGDYSIKFTAGNSAETTVNITPPSANGSGVIEFQLQMQEWANPTVTNLREESNNVIGRSVQFGTNQGDLLYLTSDKGVSVKNVEFVHAQSNVSPELAAANLKDDGTLVVQYRTGATAKDLARVISSISGLTASVEMGQIDELITASGTVATQIASVFVEETTSQFPTQYRTWTSQFGNNAADVLTFTPGVDTATSLGVDKINYVLDANATTAAVATFDAATKILTLTHTAAAKGDDLVAAINLVRATYSFTFNVAATNGTDAVTRTNGDIPLSPAITTTKQEIAFNSTPDLITVDYGTTGTTNPLSSLVIQDTGAANSATVYSWDNATATLTVTHANGSAAPTGDKISAGIMANVPRAVHAAAANNNASQVGITTALNYNEISVQVGPEIYQTIRFVGNALADNPAANITNVVLDNSLQSNAPIAVDYTGTTLKIQYCGTGGITAQQLVDAINANVGVAAAGTFSAITGVGSLPVTRENVTGTSLVQNSTTKDSGIQTVRFGNSSGDILTITPNVQGTPLFTSVVFDPTAAALGVTNDGNGTLTIAYDGTTGSVPYGQNLIDFINTNSAALGFTATVSSHSANLMSMSTTFDNTNGLNNVQVGATGTLHIATPGVNTVTKSQFGANAQNVLTLTAMAGININSVAFVQNANATKTTAAYNDQTGELTVTYFAGANGLNLADAINASGIGIKAAVSDPTVIILAAPQTAVTRLGSVGVIGNNGLDITARVEGTRFENTDVIYLVDGSVASDPNAVNGVAFTTLNNPQKASTTIMDGLKTLSFTAKEAGSKYNDIKISMANDTASGTGALSIFYSEDGKELIIRGDFSGNSGSVSYEQLVNAVSANSPFTLTVIDPNGQNSALGQRIGANFNSGVTTLTGQTPGTIGTDNQALIVRLQTGTETANDVVAAINNSKNAQTAAYYQIANSSGSSGNGQLFQNGNGTTRVFSSALKGGSNGYVSVVSSQQLIDFVNSHEELSKIISADNYLLNNGTGLLSVFDEYLYYGDVLAQTGIQFLGPKDSPDVRFVTTGANAELAVVFTSDIVTFPNATLNGYNANTAMTISALSAGEELNDVVVRFTRLNNNYSAADSSVVFESGPSNSMAYCSINDDAATTGTVQESGKFIVYSTEKSDRFNNVQIVASINGNQTENALATFNEKTKQLVITVKDASVLLTEAMDAINNTGLFTCDFDYSNNRTPLAMPPADTGSGIETFAKLFTGQTSAVIGNTGQTGGISGGVINVYLGGNDTEITSNAVVDLINKADDMRGLFTAGRFGDSDGTGIINFRFDNLTTTSDFCGGTIPVPRMITSGGVFEQGVMEIQLATDKFGNVTTTARDLVDFFNTLTAEQTRGVSASLMYPAGVFENDYCDLSWGNGILQPTLKEGSICDDDYFYNLSFTSYGSVDGAANAYSDMIAVNGINASYRVTAKVPGKEYEGVSINYITLTDELQAEHAEYDADNRIITVFTKSTTTANDVELAIESSDQTRNLFSVTQFGTGNGKITVRDASVALGDGTYEAGYRGGAYMFGAADADPNRLIFESVDTGSSQFVTVLSRGGNFMLKNEEGLITTNDYGGNIEATLNGTRMTGNGRTLGISTSMLSLSLTTNENLEAGDAINFDIVGGGAIFQLGADVVSTQQVRIGIKNVSTVTLGGPSGRLYMLREGNVASLATDTKMADRIVQEAINAVTTLRGRLGALQKCTLESNIATLQDTLEGLTAAEALISNADFAEETSKMTRAQILVQSSSSVLKTANQMPQYAAMLLS